MTLTEIKTAIAEGKTVHWSNPLYKVIKDDKGQYLIRCGANGSCIGLTWQDGVTLNGNENNFYILKEPKEQTVYIATIQVAIVSENPTEVADSISAIFGEIKANGSIIDWKYLTNGDPALAGSHIVEDLEEGQLFAQQLDVLDEFNQWRNGPGYSTTIAEMNIRDVDYSSYTDVDIFRWYKEYGVLID